MKHIVASLETPLEEAFIPALLRLAHGFTKAAGMGGGCDLRFELAAEEFSGWLLTAFPKERLRLELANEGRFARADFIFRESDIDLSAMNMVSVSPASAGSEEGLRDAGLLIASRSADRCLLRREGGRCILSALVERDFPAAAPAPAAELRGPLRIDRSEETLRLALMTAGERFPDAVMADIADDLTRAVCVADGRGSPAALLLWRLDHGTALFSAPRVFGGGAEAARLAAESFISQAFSAGAFCALCEEPLPEGAEEYFESVEGVRYRAMNEDSGGNVWASPRLIPALEEQLDSFDLQRAVTSAAFAPPAGKSLLSTSFSNGRATLEPLIIAGDFRELLAAHAAELSRDGSAVTLTLRLSEYLQASAANAAFECGFRLWYLRPGGALNDAAILRYEP